MKERAKRKRYLLLRSDKQVSEERQKDLVRALLETYPNLDTRKMVWVGGSLIIRTDQTALPAMKESLVVRSGGVVLTPSLASGSISKLKRAAAEP